MELAQIKDGEAQGPKRHALAEKGIDRASALLVAAVHEGSFSHDLAERVVRDLKPAGRGIALGRALNACDREQIEAALKWLGVTQGNRPRSPLKMEIDTAQGLVREWREGWLLACHCWTSKSLNDLLEPMSTYKLAQTFCHIHPHFWLTSAKFSQTPRVWQLLKKRCETGGQLCLLHEGTLPKDMRRLISRKMHFPSLRAAITGECEVPPYQEVVVSRFATEEVHRGRCQKLAYELLTREELVSLGGNYRRVALGDIDWKLDGMGEGAPGSLGVPAIAYLCRDSKKRWEALKWILRKGRHTAVKGKAHLWMATIVKACSRCEGDLQPLASVLRNSWTACNDALDGLASVLRHTRREWKPLLWSELIDEFFIRQAGKEQLVRLLLTYPEAEPFRDRIVRRMRSFRDPDLCRAQLCRYMEGDPMRVLRLALELLPDYALADFCETVGVREILASLSERLNFGMLSRHKWTLVAVGCRTGAVLKSPHVEIYRAITSGRLDWRHRSVYQRDDYEVLPLEAAEWQCKRHKKQRWLLIEWLLGQQWRSDETGLELLERLLERHVRTVEEIETLSTVWERVKNPTKESERLVGRYLPRPPSRCFSFDRQ